jgi:predicted nucleic acid-binding protein
MCVTKLPLTSGCGPKGSSPVCGNIFGSQYRVLRAVPSDIEFVESVSPSRRWVAQDADDDWVIQCAVTARVDYIISGDKAVLALGEVEGICIVSAGRFANEILK